MGFIALRSIAPLPELAEQVLWLAVTAAVLIFFSRPVIDFRVKHLAAALGLGVAVFVIWIGPDLISSAYRHSFLFTNSITGAPHSSLSEASRSSALLLALRAARAVLIVPIVEELFWRAWMMRWIIQPNFQKVPLGTFSPAAFWIVAALFASEHGPYWDVGLVTGVIYNWWMVRTKSLGDLILVHAVTNACLSAYVIAAGKWEYWL